jgi:hypothetical protein
MFKPFLSHWHRWLGGFSCTDRNAILADDATPAQLVQVIRPLLNLPKPLG